jgi:hypothetical protein
MGEYADYEVDRMLGEGAFPNFGRGRRRVQPRTACCSRCGSTDVKWRETDQGWRLFDLERGEHNRMYEHECTPPDADDFEVLP